MRTAFYYLILLFELKE